MFSATFRQPDGITIRVGKLGAVKTSEALGFVKGILLALAPIAYVVFIRTQCNPSSSDDRLNGFDKGRLAAAERFVTESVHSSVQSTPMYLPGVTAIPKGVSPKIVAGHPRLIAKPYPTADDLIKVLGQPSSKTESDDYPEPFGGMSMRLIERYPRAFRPMLEWDRNNSDQKLVRATIAKADGKLMWLVLYWPGGPESFGRSSDEWSKTEEKTAE